MEKVYDKTFSKKELQELNYNLKENEYIVEIGEDKYRIEYQGQYDIYHIYSEANNKLKLYYHEKYRKLGFSEEEIKQKLYDMLESSEMYALESALLNKFNPNIDVSVRLPMITDQIIDDIKQNKIFIMLIIQYMEYQTNIIDYKPDGTKEYYFSREDNRVLEEFYETHKEFIDNHIADSDFAEHFERLFKRHSMCKLLSEIVI
jgi:hypothetical protein